MAGHTGMAEVDGTAFQPNPSNISSLATVFIPPKLCVSGVLCNHNQNVLEVSFSELVFLMTIRPLLY